LMQLIDTSKMILGSFFLMYLSCFLEVSWRSRYEVSMMYLAEASMKHSSIILEVSLRSL
jgi:hypothetical protein